MSPWKSKEVQRLHKFQRQFFEAKRIASLRLYFAHKKKTGIARVTVLTVLAFCSVQSENGQSYACMRLLAHITGPELCRLLPLKNSSLHANLGLFSDNRASLIVVSDIFPSFY